MESYNPHREIVHLHVFIDVAFRPEDRELTIETLDYPDTYFVKWFTHVCCRGQQDQVEARMFAPNNLRSAITKPENLGQQRQRLQLDEVFAVLDLLGIKSSSGPSRGGAGN
ncbi:hypothetical protein DITRI_Ditri16bG0128200 [Diplodiscus trichospermus]